MCEKSVMFAFLALCTLKAVQCGEPIMTEAWSRMGMEPAFDALLHRSAMTSLNRTKRQLDTHSLALPEGAIVSIAPRFGWLLFQGNEGITNEEELDFVIQSEFIYRFPQKKHDAGHSSPSSSASGHHARLDQSNQDVLGDWQSINNAIDDPVRFILHRKKRMVRDKKMMYNGLENLFSMMGMDGRACVLRAICEVTSTPLMYDGIVGELLNVALVPSHTTGHHEDLRSYREAEEHGRLASSCREMYSKCPTSLFQHVQPASVEFH